MAEDDFVEFEVFGGVLRLPRSLLPDTAVVHLIAQGQAALDAAIDREIAAGLAGEFDQPRPSLN